MANKFKVHGQVSKFRKDSRHTLYNFKRRNDEELGPIKKFRGSGRWQKVRLAEVQKQPTCCDPLKIHIEDDMGALVESVHHVIGLLECLQLGQLERLGCLPGNLRCLCNSCHNKIEGIRDTRGAEAARRIFITAEQELELIRLVIPEYERREITPQTEDSSNY